MKMYCRNCGFELKDNDKTCPGCGSPVVPLAADATPQGRVAGWAQKESDAAGATAEKVAAPGTGKKYIYVYDDGKEYKSQKFEEVNIPKDQYEEEIKSEKKASGTSGSGRTYSTGYDSGSAGWGILGCCFPIVGLILFLVWKDDKPKNAKSAGVGALMGVILIVVFMVLTTILGIGTSMYYFGIKGLTDDWFGINI